MAERKFKRIEKDFLDLKVQVDFLEGLKGQNYSKTIETLKSISPNEVFIENINIKDDVLRLKGVSGYRNGITKLEKNLKEKFSSVDAPLSNLVKAYDANFVFTVQLKKNND